jgi:hypothetical protein
VYRFADKRWRGSRRLLLAPTALFLAARAVIEMTSRALGARPGRPQVSG